MRMETPSEWAKRFNRQKPEEEAGLSNAEAVLVESPTPVAEFPSEPFPCPTCGQLLGPSCRVCVACRRPIDPAEIARQPAVAVPGASTPGTAPRPESVRYPWRIFFAVLGIGLILGQIFLALLGDQKGLLVTQALPIPVGLWVFFDALRQRVPKPLRWALGSMLLLIVIFPWYLARRRKPRAQVRFVEAEAGPVTRFLLFGLLVLFLVSLIFYIVKGPPPAILPTPPSKEHKSGGNSVARIIDLRPWKGYGRQGRPREGPLPLAGASSTQAETSAPSDARQT